MNKNCIKYTLFALAVLFVAAPLWAELEEPVLQVGLWVKGEPWHSWIGGESRTSDVKLNIMDNDNTIERVDFFYSIDNGLSWTFFGTDTNGQEPSFTTVTQISTPTGTETVDPALLEDGDGWLAVFSHGVIPQENMKILFRSLAYTDADDTIETFAWRLYDPTPPDEGVVTYTYINHDTLLVSVSDPYQNLDSITIISQVETETFYKGIPCISQHPHSDYHCLPTAAAACLKYFEGKGDPTITGGLSDSSLVDTLGDESGTNKGKKGTYLDDLVDALWRWINSHGGNYSIRHSHSFDWNTASNELKRCQDVLAGIQWSDGSWHMMTFNSIVNEPNYDGTYRVDFMDPWTGQIEWGDYNPATGELTGFRGTWGNMYNMVIICPNEQNPYISSGGDPIGGSHGPNPIPQPVPLSDSLSWSLKVCAVDLEGNAYTYITVVPALSTDLDNQQGSVIPNFYLAQNSPNPFTDRTEIGFALPARKAVTVTVFDAAGRKVITLAKTDFDAGVHKLSWDGTDAKGRKVQPGVYFCEMKTDSGFKQTVKMLLVK